MFRFWLRFASRATPSLRERALTSLKRGQFAGAEAALTQLLDAPQDATTARERAFLINKRGIARVGLGRRDLGRADFEAALALFEAYAPALTNLGNLALENGDLEAAIARYESAIAADPDYPAAHLNLGIAYKHAGRVQDGVRMLRRAQKLDWTTFLRRRRPP